MRLLRGRTRLVRPAPARSHLSRGDLPHGDLPHGDLPRRGSAPGHRCGNGHDPLTSDHDLWVFGYGSLIWRPGFDFIDRVPARLIGGHRALCVFSHVHRGTPERPGLVLGLDQGGSCRGIAYRVAAAQREETLAYLRGREQATMVYREAVRSVWLDHAPAQRVAAVCYLVDRGHPQYAGRLTLDEQLRLVRQGHGRSGANPDYVLETVRALEALGFNDADLRQLADRLGGAAPQTAHPRPA